MRWRPAIGAVLATVLTLAGAGAAAAQVSDATGSRPWVSISPASVSLDPTSPPDNYGLNTIVVDPTTHGSLYLGTNYQGIEKSTDGGLSWSKVNTGSGSNLVDSGRIWSLALDPFNHLTLYAASGYGAGGPLKSTDGGVSWTSTLPSGSAAAQQVGTNDVYNVAVDPYTPNHVLAAFHYFWHDNQDSGVIESNDGGASWTIHTPPPGGGWGAGNSVWFLDNSRTWLVGSQSAGLWRTVNAGQTWAQVSQTNIAHGGVNALYRSPTTGTLVIATWNGLLRSTDDGQTWQDFSSGLPYAAYETVLGDGSHLYTAPSFAEHNNEQADGPWYSASENGGSWMPYSSQTPCVNGVCNGPVDGAFDATTGTLYAVAWNAGAWMLPSTPATQ